ncbi:pilin, partial [Patescibacteria group bacterium]|nr:pilin [Patescibacteria group bacterium]
MLRRLKTLVWSEQDRQKCTKRSAIKVLLFSACFFCLLIIPIAAFAQLTTSDVGLQYAAEIGLTTTDIRTIVARVINAFLGLLGLLAVSLFIYAGYLYMTAGGDSSKVDQAKKLMINVVIGLAIIMAAYAITAFIFQAITGASLLGGGGRGGSSSSLSSLRGGSSHILGNGIIEYHYPEVGQTDVPRNTNISITFKRPFVLSTVFMDYEDNGTYDTADDIIPEVLQLNTDNFKVIPNESLGAVEGSVPDDRFNSRYPDAGLIAPPTARVSMVAAEFDPQDLQTLVILPTDYLGSSTADVTYRVAIRGGDNGVRVWVPGEEEGEPEVENAFDSMNADGGYYWPFTTGTTLDLTPPQILSVEPEAVINPALEREILPRNQLLQIYFNEPMDPTTSSGRTDRGLTNILVEGRCLPGADCDCWIPGDTCESFMTIPGAVNMGPRYRAVEFISSIPCEGVSVNSCGDPVYCLPRNIEIRVRALAATLSTDPPKAAAPNGPLDMVGNSLDGNSNGVAEGPRVSDYILNTRVGDGDSVRWLYHVGSTIDLTEPVITQIDPLAEVPPPDADDLHPDGPSNVPVNLPITITWSKVMGIGSMRSGAYNETAAPGDDELFIDSRTTIALRSRELEKEDRTADCTDPAEPCRTLPPLPPPAFFIGVGDGPVLIGEARVTRMNILHRDFLTAN